MNENSFGSKPVPLNVSGLQLEQESGGEVKRVDGEGETLAAATLRENALGVEMLWEAMEREMARKLVTWAAMEGDDRERLMVDKIASLALEVKELKARLGDASGAHEVLEAPTETTPNA